MREKIVSLLLVCLVALSIVYGCSSAALSSQATQSMDAVPSRPTTVTEEIRQKGKLSRPGPPLNIMGDPIPDVKPH